MRQILLRTTNIQEEGKLKVADEALPLVQLSLLQSPDEAAS